MSLTSRLEQATSLDPAVSAGQRAARLIRPGRIRDALHGCLACPWHGSAFRIADGSVARGPATAPHAGSAPLKAPQVLSLEFSAAR
jgi:nitrite reductase/ring-hydroxylating ferredoxin subunit